MPPVIDCHALIVSADRRRYPFGADAAPPAPGEIEASLSPERLAEALDAGLIAGAVLVQRGRFHGADNRLVVDTAGGDARLRALVSSDGDVRALLDARHVAGLRLMEPRKGADLSWLAGDGARRQWALAAARGAIVDVHVFPWNRAAALPALAGLLAEFAGATVLLDNLGAAGVEQGRPDFGIDAPLAAVADHPRLILKFSDMTLARLDRAGLDAAAAVARCARLVGSERLCWGSDVLAPGRSYPDAIAATRAAVAGLPSQDQARIFGGNARRLFGLPEA